MERLTSRNTPVVIRGLELFQYKELHSFIKEYFSLIECMKNPENDRQSEQSEQSEQFGQQMQFNSSNVFYGLCVYRPRTSKNLKAKSLPSWW